jgi:hypothetical protein
MARVLHAGFHKTGSTFLQSAFFPKLENVLFIQKLDLATVRQLSNHDRSILFSNEAACGYQYPLTKVFSTARLENSLEITQCKKVILVVREFHSWILSLYFQTLNEKHHWSIEEFIYQNRENLLSWKNAPKVIAQMCKERGVELLMIEYHDLHEDRIKTLQRISTFIDGSNFDSTNITDKGRHNISRYGTLTIKVYRLLNRTLDNKLGRCLERVIRRSPRKLIQGRLGTILDRLSTTRLSSADVEKLM